MTVKVVKSSASDEDVVRAARVSTLGENDPADSAENRNTGLIKYLVRDRHGSPFEHTFVTFYIETTIFVWREFMRHRIASYNEESGRYKVLRPIFYIPARDRNLIQEGKPGAYSFVPGTDEQWALMNSRVREASVSSYEAYTEMLDAGIAREVARIVLPVNTYSSAYVTMNMRALTNFLSLRTKREDATFPSFPQREIEMVAEQMEAFFAESMPVTYAAWNENGRAPL